MVRSGIRSAGLELGTHSPPARAGRRRLEISVMRFGRNHQASADLHAMKGRCAAMSRRQWNGIGLKSRRALDLRHKGKDYT